MSDITLEKMNKLLEKLAEHVVTKVPTREEIITKEEFSKAIDYLHGELYKKADKKDVEKIKQGMDTLLGGMDAQAKQLDIIRTEQVTTNAALQRHEKRITALEEKQTGYRIQDAEVRCSPSFGQFEALELLLTFNFLHFSLDLCAH